MPIYEVRLLNIEGDLLEVIDTSAEGDTEALEKAARLNEVYGAANYFVRRWGDEGCP